MSLMRRNARKHMYTPATRVLTEGTDCLCMDAAPALDYRVQGSRFRFRKATDVALGFYKVPLRQASSAGSAPHAKHSGAAQAALQSANSIRGAREGLGAGAQAPTRRTQPSSGPGHRVGKATGQHCRRRRCRTAPTQPASQTSGSVPGVIQKKPDQADMEHTTPDRHRPSKTVGTWDCASGC